MTNQQLLLLPLFLHVALIGLVGTRNVLGRVASVRRGETRMKDIALDTSKWPPHLRKLGNNFDNQFDLPMMWYGLCALLIATGKVDGIMALLSWAFFLSRLVHSYIHTGSNRLPQRMYAYLAGMIAIVMMWIWFGLRLFVIG